MIARVTQIYLLDRLNPLGLGWNGLRNIPSDLGVSFVIVGCCYRNGPACAMCRFWVETFRTFRSRTAVTRSCFDEVPEMGLETGRLTPARRKFDTSCGKIS